MALDFSVLHLLHYRWFEFKWCQPVGSFISSLDPSVSPFCVLKGFALCIFALSADVASIYTYIYPLMPGSRLRLSTAQRNSTQLNSSLDWLCALALVIENASLFLTSLVEAQPGGRAKRGEGATFRHFPKPVAIHCRTYCIKLIFRQVCN